LSRYEKEYEFRTQLGANSWLSFLQEYFDKTKRKSRAVEDGVEPRRAGFRIASEFFKQAGALSGGKPDPQLDGGKPDPQVGDVCTCPSIKNYPEDEEPKQVRGKKRVNVRAVSLSHGALRAYTAPSGADE
jgi:hypothetical protein